MFEGSYTALVTPFREGRVDEEALAGLVAFQIENGTEGLVPCGTTGESATLTHEEHVRVVELVVKAARGRVKVLAGTGSNATEEAIDLTRAAKAAGADGALLITPYYNKPTQRGLLEHFRAVARSVDIPLVPYNVPSRTAVNMLPATVVELARTEKKVVGVKEASGSLDQATEIIQALGDGFDLLSGDDSLTLPLLSLGAKGVISVVANIVPRDVSALCAAARRGDWPEARRLHHKLYPLAKAMFLETNPAPVKTAMAWLEMCRPDIRLPLAPMEGPNEDRLKKVMQDYGLLAGPRRPGC